MLQRQFQQIQRCDSRSEILVLLRVARAGGREESIVEQCREELFDSFERSVDSTFQLD